MLVTKQSAHAAGRVAFHQAVKEAKALEEEGASSKKVADSLETDGAWGVTPNMANEMAESMVRLVLQTGPFDGREPVEHPAAPNLCCSSSSHRSRNRRPSYEVYNF